MAHSVINAARLADAVALVRREGVSALAQRVIRLAYRRYVGLVDFPLRPEDVVDGRPEATAQGVRPPPGSPLTLAWICAPPAAGSGGHTTMFRMIHALEGAGHRCVVLLHDRYDGNVQRHRAGVRRNWPHVRADVHLVGEVLPPAHAYVATSWDTAHVLAKRCRSSGQRFYFVQDFEPFFYSRGAEYALAEATYRFGYHGVTAGPWLADLLRSEYGMSCDSFDFGADLETYRVENSARRSGVVFYSKPGAPRRGHLLGVLALQRFSALRPDVPIHVFGNESSDLPFKVQHHGVLSPTELNLLYNQCAAGLSLSFTNVSLLPWELLAAGVVPVINDAVHNRRVLRADGVTWSEPTPAGIATALAAAVDGRSPAPSDLAKTVSGMTWDAAGASVVEAVERKVYFG